LEDGTFPEAGSLRRPLLQESSVPKEHSGFNFELYGGEPASLRLNPKLQKLKHFWEQSELLNRVVCSAQKRKGDYNIKVGLRVKSSAD
jgi:hypothetical protein